jgi:hypothetical protein
VDDRTAEIFKFEIETQCRFILRAEERLRTVPGDVMLAWQELQTVVVSAANISKILWGSSGRKEKEREPLRRALKVPDDSPLRDPDLRNDFEHFDERIDLFFDGAPTRPYAGRNIGDVASFGGPSTDWFGFFDPFSGVITFWEHSVSLPALVGAANQLLIEIAAQRRW